MNSGAFVDTPTVQITAAVHPLEGQGSVVIVICAETKFQKRWPVELNQCVLCIGSTAQMLPSNHHYSAHTRAVSVSNGRLCCPVVRPLTSPYALQHLTQVRSTVTQNNADKI